MSSPAYRPLPPATYFAPAKLNLDLRVGAPRADGFHPIRSWFVTVGLFDRLDFSPADDIRLTCSDPTIPVDGRNLVVRAAEALRPGDGRGVLIHLEKSIPAGGGLGGGSSDAATTLLALNEFWKLGLPIDRLHDIAATLGSDVPFFLHGPSSLCEGRGDVVTPVPPPGCGQALLVLPGLHMPTPAVFKRLDELRPTVPDFAHGTVVVGGAGALALLPGLSNDLETPAFDLRPELAELRQEIEGIVARPVRMSGSGSTLFTLYDTDAEAQAAQTVVTQKTGMRCVVAGICPGPRHGSLQ
ncbi:MAG: 4-(cytidine 5'-diphospho)-2-C-methyl-D-erythritol kinase [Tepidisphaeraceae bacterium]